MAPNLGALAVGGHASSRTREPQPSGWAGGGPAAAAAESPPAKQRQTSLEAARSLSVMDIMCAMKQR